MARARRRLAVAAFVLTMTVAACSGEQAAGPSSTDAGPTGVTTTNKGHSGHDMSGMPGMSSMTSSMGAAAGDSSRSSSSPAPASSVGSASAPATTTTTPTGQSAGNGLPGMPPVTDPHNVYAAAGAGMVDPKFQDYPAYAYVPHSGDGDVWVIDQHTFKVVAKFHAGREVQHVVPSWDMKTLYATDDLGDRDGETGHLLEIDPKTGKPGRRIVVTDPYNMYFTPDGKYAISVAEKFRELVWYDPVTWEEKDVTKVPDCGGIDHADFTADGRIALFSCEFAGRVALIDVASHRVLKVVALPQVNTTMGPQDVKLSPDGKYFFVADSDSNGVWQIDADTIKVIRHIATGGGAHGLYLNRAATIMYVTNRHEGSVSLLDAYTGEVKGKWEIPGGGSPDMGNVSADGSQLWLSGRYDGVVYVLDTTDGHLITRIPVGDGPHGMALMPLPGRYSLGHTGITR